ncbi:hypothetical protein GCM10019016_023990 [Streptomyces prasinosporus]|uniref:Uncharacterized protein n=1 Tax=Streptomyces prasinosporus TaxID=68256 RepID=A0ABP6TJ87_9ACTN|nr:hypothetical protein GCM10010332_66790 [Streptomyces albogriseolus]
MGRRDPAVDRRPQQHRAGLLRGEPLRRRPHVWPPVRRAAARHHRGRRDHAAFAGRQRLVGPDPAERELFIDLIRRVAGAAETLRDPGQPAAAR